MSCLGCVLGKRAARKQNDLGTENVIFYSYKELRNATDDFSTVNKVGKGGFGSVYKGILKNGKFVAIKVLSEESKQGIHEFLTELTVISNVVHENLVALHGCCVQQNQRILVYNYLENNSLEQTLLGANRSGIQFNWKTRTKICIGVARGLAFLHEEVTPPILHRDIKASNVLLDKDLTPKISDFGLAKLLPPNMTHVSTRVKGTIGYLAPEYALRGQVTKKSDIYSFGVLLLEIVSGRSNRNTRLPYEEVFLLDRVWALFERGDLVKMVDRSLSDDLDIKEACRFLKIGLLCTQDELKLRPSMSTVVEMLKGERDIESEKISKPGLVSDFMDLKVRKQTNVSSATSSGLANSLSSVDLHASASMTFPGTNEQTEEFVEIA